MSPTKYFGTDGVRGRVGGPVINPETMLKLGWAIGSVFKAASSTKPCVLIGRDTRISGELLEASLQKGLLAVGVDIVLLGVLSTPAIAYFTQKFNAAAGIVISASHNPYEDNGVKIIGANGLKLSDASEAAIEAAMQNACHLSQSDSSGTVTMISDAASQYISHCTTLFKNVSLKGLKLVIDCAQGATFSTAEKIFSDLGASVILIHATPDGFNINDHCGATDVSSLRERVLAEKADCGIAFDGDGDRLMMVDHCGEIVDGDEILCVLAMYNDKCTAVVGTLMSNLGLEQALKKRHIQFERVAVGDRYVLEKLQKNNWQLGGEASGHIVNLNYSTTGDGILSALQVLEIMQDTKQSLHQLKKVMQKRPQILINVSVKSPHLFSSMQSIQDALRDAENKLGDRGRVLLRASGTESCVRVMVEADDEAEARMIVQTLADVVRDAYESSSVGL